MTGRLEPIGRGGNSTLLSDDIPDDRPRAVRLHEAQNSRFLSRCQCSVGIAASGVDCADGLAAEDCLEVFRLVFYPSAAVLTVVNRGASSRSTRVRTHGTVLDAG